MRAASLVHDVLHIFIPKLMECTDDRKRRALPKTAERHGTDHLRQILQLVQIVHLSSSVDNLLQNLQHPLGSLAAGRAFPTGFTLSKAHKEAGNLDHARALVQDDHAA